MTRGFFLETVQITRREVIEDKNRINVSHSDSPPEGEFITTTIKHEEVEVVLRLHSTGKTKKMSNDKILSHIIDKIDFIPYEENKQK